MTADLVAVSGANGMKAAALKLAQALDDTLSARDMPPIAKELRAILDALGVEATRQAEAEDGVVILAERRASRRAAAQDRVGAAGGK